MEPHEDAVVHLRAELEVEPEPEPEPSYQPRLLFSFAAPESFEVPHVLESFEEPGGDAHLKAAPELELRPELEPERAPEPEPDPNREPAALSVALFDVVEEEKEKEECASNRGSQRLHYTSPTPSIGSSAAGTTCALAGGAKPPPPSPPTAALDADAPVRTSPSSPRTLCSGSTRLTAPLSFV